MSILTYILCSNMDCEMTVHPRRLKLSESDDKAADVIKVHESVSLAKDVI